jgi:hypothetical protein
MGSHDCRPPHVSYNLSLLRRKIKERGFVQPESLPRLRAGAGDGTASFFGSSLNPDRIARACGRTHRVAELEVFPRKYFRPEVVTGVLMPGYSQCVLDVSAKVS